MGRAVAWFVLLCACDQVFGVRSTGLIDASMLDAPPPDAAATCPASATAPQLSANTFTLAGSHGCAAYIESAGGGFAMMQCPPQIMQGPIGGTLQAIALPPLTGASHYEMPRPSPEGDLLITRAGDTLSGYDYVAFANVADAWTATPITLPSLPRTGYLSQPSAAPNRHMLFVDAFHTLEELVDDGTNTWTVAATYDTRALGGVVTPVTPSLSSDGLRMVLTGYPSGGSISVLYSARADVMDMFPPLAPLNVPGGAYPFLSADCGKLYVDADNDILFLTR